MWSFALVEPKSPRMSLTLDAVENNGLSPSLRRGAREGDFRDLCILLGHLRAKIPQLQAALECQVRDHHRFLLQSLLLQL